MASTWTPMEKKALTKKRCIEAYNKVAGTEYDHKDTDEAIPAIVFEVQSVLTAKTKKEAMDFLNTLPEEPPVEYGATPYEIWLDDWKAPGSAAVCINRLRKAVFNVLCRS